MFQKGARTSTKLPTIYHGIFYVILSGVVFQVVAVLSLESGLLVLFQQPTTKKQSTDCHTNILCGLRRIGFIIALWVHDGCFSQFSTGTRNKDHGTSTTQNAQQ